MKKVCQNILDKWLEVEYYAIARKSTFIEKKLDADYAMILDTIRCLDSITSNKNKELYNYVITILALMWEHTDKSKYDLKNFILKMLSRIGYPTSAIIIDSDFHKNDSKFFRPNSFLDMISLTLEQQSYEVSVNDHTFLLTEFQKTIWDAMDRNKTIGISAPTSAGKSFVLLIKTLSNIIMNSVDIVYIVPTLSLLNQVTEDYNKYIKLLKIEDCKIVNSFIPNTDKEKSTIYVLTQEKALAAFSNEESAFNRKLILVADEIQNIERIHEDSDLRAKILFDTLIEFRQRKNVKQIVLSGPRIEEIDSLGVKIFGEKTLELKTSVSPVLNLTYSIKKEGKKFYFKQYCALKESSFSREIQKNVNIAGYGQKLYTPEYLAYLSSFINNIGADNQNIIFAPTSDKAKDIACSIASSSQASDSMLDDLITYYADTINVNYAMCATLKKHIAYHHGKLPMHVRRTLEKAISDKKIQNVVCTTTLMQGVNMPAQNVIIRNPHLYISKKEGTGELSSYEMANLRGRAGRLLKDFIGRTYVLDESGFDGLDDYDQLDLFDDTTLELPAGYGEKYEEYKYEVDNTLSTGSGVDHDMQKYGYLVSYIRQTILRYGDAARERMKNVGINLTKEQVAAIILKMKSLKVPKDVCYKNRYWDPIVLNTIYTELSIKKLPSIPTERGARARLDEALKFLRDNKTTQAMFERYIPELNRNGTGRSLLCSACMNWSCEKPLSDILTGERYEGEDATKNIDTTIDLLQKIVSFNVPLLLKPIFDIFNKDSVFLLCMQVGAYKPITRRMIEIGIPRETAIYLNKSLFGDSFKVDATNEEHLEEIIRERVAEKHSSLPYWIQVQLEFMI